MMIFFFKGLILGFSVVAPVGPIGILCINWTLIKGHISCLVTGLGATTADLFGIDIGSGKVLILFGGGYCNGFISLNNR